MEEVDAAALSHEALAAALLRADRPMLVRGGLAADWVDAGAGRGLLAQHARVPVQVVVEGGTYRGEPTREAAGTAGAFFASMRNGSLPGGAYIFYELGGVDVRGGGFELAGADVSAEAKALLRSVPALADTTAALMRAQAAAQAAAGARARDGRVLLSAGSWGNGRPFHAHGPALFT